MDAWLIIVLVVGIALAALGVFAFVTRGSRTEPGPRPGDLDAVAPTDRQVAADHDTKSIATIEPDTLVVDDVSETSGREASETVAPVRPKFRDRIAKARGTVSGYLAAVVGRSSIESSTWDDLEEALIRADVGVTLTSEVLDGLRAQVKAEGITEPQRLLEVLRADLAARLSVDDRSLHLSPKGTSVWLLVGVNGVGKTTTAGKLGARFTNEGKAVTMVAGDTFRAAAAEQLETWANRCGAQFVRGAEGADPSSVIFDGIESGVSHNSDLVICDTAGRLHNKENLMKELEKVRRVADKAPGEVTEVLLVLDATTGQNGLAQAKIFTEVTDVTGVVLTKLDGSAKGGIVMAIQSELGIPVKLVGLGESADDLVDFAPAEFVDALLSVDAS